MFRRVSVAFFCTSTAASDVTTASFSAVPFPNVPVPAIHPSVPFAVTMSFVIVKLVDDVFFIRSEPSPAMRPVWNAVQSGVVNIVTGLPAVSVSTIGWYLYPSSLISNTPPASGAKEISRSTGFAELK